MEEKSVDGVLDVVLVIHGAVKVMEELEVDGVDLAILSCSSVIWQEVMIS